MADDPFLVSIDKYLTKTQAKLDAYPQAIAAAALARVKELTPVDTGYLRANWTVIASGSAQAITATKDATEREKESLAVVLKLRAGDTFTLMNPVIYARRVETGFVGQDSLGRHYDQKGAFMMTQTIAEMPQIAARAIEQVNQR